LKKNIFDLHCHTTISDGTFTPTDLINKAIEENFETIAITDHDNIEGVKEAQRAAKNSGLTVIPGVEISVEYSPGTMHMCGYFVDTENFYFRERLDYVQEARRQRNPKIVQKLRDTGFDITMKEIEQAAGGKQIGRPHFATVLYEKGYVKNKQEAFDKYLDKSASCYVNKERLSLEESIKCITVAGGIPVLAHPIQLRLKDEQEYREMFRFLKNKGVLGIECYTSHQTDEENALFLKLAREIGLLITGGSDFHGSNKPNVKLGYFGNHVDINPNQLIEEMMGISGK